MFKATIGCVYHEDPDGVRAWGEIWLRPVVVRAHDILVDLQGYRPLISGVHPSVSTDSVSTTQEEQDDISSLMGKQNPVEKKDLEKSQPSSRHSSGKMRIILRSFTPPPAQTPSPSVTYEQHDDLSKALASMSITDQASRRSSPNTSERARRGFSEESRVEAKHNAKPVRVQQLSGAVGSLNLHHNDRSRSFSNAEGCAQAGKWCPIGEQSLNTTKVNVKVSGTNEPSNMSTDSVPSKLKKSHSIQNMPSSTKDKENCRDHIVPASSTPTDIVSEPTPQAKTYGGRISDCHDEDGPDNVAKKTETKLVSSQLQSQLKVTMFLPRAVSNKGRQRGAVSEHNPLRRFD
ncbi:hypothetical protein C8Q75DRAFT_455530 [Abortiporus biennis]|nr:hypothetical protein C8Q75DRAFT_455530 [Abortiporus biennis]